VWYDIDVGEDWTIVLFVFFDWVSFHALLPKRSIICTKNIGQIKLGNLITKRYQSTAQQNIDLKYNILFWGLFANVE